MKKNKKRIIIVSLVLAIVLVIGLVFYCIHQNQKTLESQFKKDYQSGDRVAQLYDLLGSDRYAKDLRKAGYKIPDDGMIHKNGFVDKVTLSSKEGTLEILGKPNKEEDFKILTFKQIEGKNILVSYTFNKNLRLTYKSYHWFDHEGINHEITIPKTDEDRLVKQVQKEVDEFLDTMYHQIYD